MTETRVKGYQGYRNKLGFSAAGEWALRFTSPVLWTLGTFVLVGCCGCLGAVVPPMASFLLAPAAGLLAVAFIDAIVRTYREKRAQLVLGYLENAVRLNLPLPYFLDAAGQGEGFVVRHRLQDLRDYLAGGRPLAEALALGLPELSAREVGLLEAAEENGNTEEVLTRLVEEDLGRVEETESEGTIMHRGYVLMVLVALVTIGSFVMIFVIPKFREIFKDFKTNMPALTEFWLDVSDWIANDFGWVFFLVPFFLLLGWGSRMLRRMVAPWWPTLVPGTWKIFAGRWLMDYVPVAGGMRRDGELGDYCRAIAEGMRAGRGPVEVLGSAESAIRSPMLMRRVREWKKFVEGGRDWAEGAKAAGMPALFYGMLFTFGGGGTREELARLMEFLGGHYRMKFSRTAIVLRATMEPLLTLVLALVVGSFVVGLFLPLVVLINTVMGYDGVRL